MIVNRHHQGLTVIILQEEMHLVEVADIFVIHISTINACSPTTWNTSAEAMSIIGYPRYTNKRHTPSCISRNKESRPLSSSVDQTRLFLPGYGICWGISHWLVIFQWMCNSCLTQNEAAFDFDSISPPSISPCVCIQIINTSLRT